MEEYEISALDLRFLVPELKAQLVGGRIQKIYQYGNEKRFLFGIYKKKSKMLYFDPKSIFVTKSKESAPQEPPSFCMFLRKHLMGKKILDIRQYEFDRIVEMETEDGKLVFELFPPGNLILVGGDGKITRPAEFQKWKKRKIEPGVPYRYPPKTTDPFELTHSDLMRMLRNTDKNLGAFCAVSLSFGPVYGDEVIARAGLDSDIKGSELNAEQAEKLFTAIQEIEGMGLNPVLYRGFAAPFPLETKRENYEKMPTFSDALESLITTAKIRIKEEMREESVLEEKKRLERIKEKQVQAKGKWKKKKKSSKEKGDLIYSHYQTVKSVIKGIQKACDMDIPWDKIKKEIKSGDIPEAEAVKEIREKDGIVVLEIEDKEIEIDFTKDVETNAARYYEKSKQARKKMGGAKEAAKETRMETKKLEEKLKEEETPEVKPKKTKKGKKKRRKKWFEKFKWFVSSEGFLVVAGRNAKQNEKLLKKKTEDDEWVFHADIPGAAFVVIKNEKDKKITEITMKEAAEFAAANSKAWARGLGTVDIFSVKRKQLSKPEGSLPKGAFVVSGERIWYRKLELKLSIGVKIMDGEAIVIAGPVMAVRKQTPYFITIQPGFKKAGELVREIKNKILMKAKPEEKYLIEKIKNSEFEKVIPAGMGEIVLYG